MNPRLAAAEKRRKKVFSSSRNKIFLCRNEKAFQCRRWQRWNAIYENLDIRCHWRNSTKRASRNIQSAEISDIFCLFKNISGAFSRGKGKMFLSCDAKFFNKFLISAAFRSFAFSWNVFSDSTVSARRLMIFEQIFNSISGDCLKKLQSGWIISKKFWIWINRNYWNEVYE